MTMEVTKVDFDTNGGKVRLSGKNVEENKWIKVCKMRLFSFADIGIDDIVARRISHVRVGTEQAVHIEQGILGLCCNWFDAFSFAFFSHILLQNE